MSERIEGFDFARALALFGMFIVNFTAVVGAEGNGSYAMQWFIGLFEGRASALFVVLAGIGLSLMVKDAKRKQNRELQGEKIKIIRKRAIFLFIVGLMLYVIGWTGDILHYYGVYLFVGSFLIFSSIQWIVWLMVGIICVTEWMQLNLDYLYGWLPSDLFIVYTDFWSVTGFFRHLLFNGYHPLFPWICFLFIGILLGRMDWNKKKNRTILFIVSVIVFVTTEVLSKWMIHQSANVLGEEAASFIFQTGPIPPNIFYILSNSASAIVIILLSIFLCKIFSRRLIVKSIIQTGQMSFTHYVSHIFIGLGILIMLNRLENETLLFSFVFSTVFFIGSILFSTLWCKKNRRGPVEKWMRKLTG